jgi:hypothetical protein
MITVVVPMIVVVMVVMMVVVRMVVGMMVGPAVRMMAAVPSMTTAVAFGLAAIHRSNQEASGEDTADGQRRRLPGTCRQGGAEQAGHQSASAATSN